MGTIKIKNIQTGKWEILPTMQGEKGERGEAGAGFPTGGTTGQILSKKSDTDFDTEWVNPSTGDLTEIYNAIYPIGRGFIDFTNTDYSNHLGFTWERELVGMFPVGYNADDEDFNTIGKTGGEKTHTLTAGELPKTTGSVTIGSYVAVASNEVGLFGNPTGIITTSNNTQSQYRVQASDQVSGCTREIINISFGNDQAHNNLPPYQVVAYWKRIA